MTRQKTDEGKTPKLKKKKVTRKFRRASCEGTADARVAEHSEAEESSEEEPQTKRQRRVREKKSDPFVIPPSGCDATVFRIQQPFVGVQFAKNVKAPEGDRVRDGESMDAEALKFAISVMSKEYILASMTSHSPASELAYRDLHVALIKSFWWLTSPRKVHKINIQEYFAAMGRKSEKKQRVLEECSGLHIKVDTRATTSSEPLERISSGSLDVRPRYIIKCQVYDESIDGMDKSVAALIVECKWGSLSVEDILQVATYACEAVKKNLEKGNTRPMHLEVWNEMMWRYAVLYPTGVIKLQAQNIVDIKGSTSSKESLMNELDSRKRNGRYPGLEYRDGEYLQGMLYVSNETFSLPGRTLAGSLMDTGSRLFYQSKLRILVGERVLRWNVDDVKRAVQDRDQALTEQHAMLLDG